MLRYVNESAGSSFLTQGGFRTNHSCNDMIIVLQEAMLKMKKKIRVAFLDIKAAYNSVDRRILCVRNAYLTMLFLTMLFLLFIYY